MDNEYRNIKLQASAPGEEEVRTNVAQIGAIGVPGPAASFPHNGATGNDAKVGSVQDVESPSSENPQESTQVEAQAQVVRFGFTMKQWKMVGAASILVLVIIVAVVVLISNGDPLSQPNNGIPQSTFASDGITTGTSTVDPTPIEYSPVSSSPTRAPTPQPTPFKITPVTPHPTQEGRTPTPPPTRATGAPTRSPSPPPTQTSPGPTPSPTPPPTRATGAPTPSPSPPPTQTSPGPTPSPTPPPTRATTAPTPSPSPPPTQTSPAPTPPPTAWVNPIVTPRPTARLPQTSPPTTPPTASQVIMSNDHCIHALNIMSLPFSMADTTAGSTPDFAIETCNIGSEASGVWYTYTPTETRSIRVFVEITSGSTRSYIRVFSGDDCDALTCLLYSGFSPSTRDSSATFVGQAGVTYKVLVSTASYTLGISSYTITVQDYDLENDACDDARNIVSLPYQLADTTVGALPDFDIETCGIEASAGGVWYTYTPSETRSIRVFVEITSGYTRSYIRVFSGDDCDALTCLLYSGFSPSTRDSSATFVGQAGVTYKVLVSTASYTLGISSYTITVQDYDLENDACDDARNIVSLPYQLADTTVGALPDFDIETCGIEASAGGVWYTYTPSETRSIRVFVEITSGYTRSYIRVFSGDDCDALTCLLYSGFSPSTRDSSATFVGQAGVTYKVLVSTASYTLGISSYTITVQDYDLENDACDDARNIVSLPYQLADTTVGALPDFDIQTCGVDASAGGVWYTYTPPETRSIRVFVERTSGSTRSYMRVFSGEDCDALTCLVYSGFTSNGDSSATFIGQAGVTYKILVSTASYTLGISSYTITVQDYDLENDACDDARNIASLPYQLADTTVGALPDFDIQTCGVDASAGGVWYTYTPFETRSIRVFVERTSGTSSYTLPFIRVFSGNQCGALECLGSNGGRGRSTSYTFVAQGGVTYKFLVSTGVYGLGIASYTISVGEQQ
ncbi:unnamed protein product [Cylindrotheca closterium]|uniref:Uncharacterized protein n=1 Tax=Cylindrotheca closterium TaxID=2856 RepID=A0AAD2CF89_9STRA|nr:unnamed protein product [Cylindrotheca closterium]